MNSSENVTSQVYTSKAEPSRDCLTVLTTPNRKLQSHMRAGKIAIYANYDYH